MTNPFKILENKSITFKWFLSYLIVLIIPVLFSLIVYMESEKIIKEQLHQSTLTMLNEMSDTIDQQLDHVQKLSMQIAFDTRVQSIIKSNMPLSPEDKYAHLQTIQDFKVYKNTTPANYIHDFMIYLKEQKTLISPIGKYRADYLSIYTDQIKITADNFDAMLGSKQNGFLSFPQSPYIVFRQALPHHSNNPDAVILIFIDDIKIRQWVESLEQLNQGSVYIFDSNQEMMLSSQRGEMPRFDFHKMQEKTGLYYERRDGEKYAVSYIQSSQYDWTYVTVIPESLFSEKLSYINKTTVICISISLALGLFMAMILVRKQYKPVHSILRSLTKTDVEKSTDRNEWNLIEKALEDTLNENEVSKQRLHRQHKAIQSHLIERLMKGRMEKNYALDDLLHSLQIKFTSEYFLVSVIYVEDYQFHYGAYDLDEANKWELVRFIISNIMGEILEASCSQIMVEIDDMLVCLINLQNEENKGINQEKEDIISKIYEAQHFINKHFMIQFTISLSCLHQSMEGIPEAYEEALRAMEYKFLIGNSKVIQYESFKEAESQYYYSLEQEQQLLNYVKAGDYANAEALIVEVIDRFATGKTTSIEMLKCFMFDITSTIIKAFDEIRINQEKWVLDQVINDLMNCRTLIEMKQHILALLQKMTDFIHEKKGSRSEELKENILQYVYENYKNADMSVSMIADHFNKDAVYISKYFKELNGEGILDVISKTRISESKRRLRETNETIRDIGQDIGFLNSNTFIRTFKKYEGITPGKYRESNSGSDSSKED